MLLLLIQSIMITIAILKIIINLLLPFLIIVAAGLFESEWMNR